MKVGKTLKAKQRRKYRTRKKVAGTPERPRLSVFRSSRHIYAQVIDDVAGVTLASASTKCKPLAVEISKSGNIAAAKKVGEAVAKAALGVGIKCVCYDRGPYKYHGRCKALADAARKAGLVF